MDSRTKFLGLTILLILGISMTLMVGCALNDFDDSTEFHMTREVLMATPLSTFTATQDNVFIESIDEHQKPTIQGELTPIVQANETPHIPIINLTQESKSEEALITTLFPTPTLVNVDIDSLGWKVAIPYVADSCQITIIDSLGQSLIIPVESSVSCLAVFHPDGKQLAVSTNKGIELIDLSSNERRIFENPLIAQLTGEGYSLLEVHSGGWSQNNKWLKVLARSNFDTSASIETRQTVIINTLSGDITSFKEDFRFQAWSPVNENEFAYISLQRDSPYDPSVVYSLGIWDMVSSKSVITMGEFPERYNFYSSKLVLSPDGRYAIVNVKDDETLKDITLIIDFLEGSWKVLFEEPQELLPWAWSPNKNWIAFAHTNKLYFSNGWGNSEPMLISLDIPAIPIGWLPSEDVFFYKYNQAIYAGSPNAEIAPSLLVNLANMEKRINQYSSIAFWAERQ